MSESQGRAKGRARGRARGQRPPEEARKPGQGLPAQAAQLQAAAQQPGLVTGQGPQTGGRASHRGSAPTTSREQGRPGGDTASAVQLPSLMTALSLTGGNGDNGSRGAGRGASRGRKDTYVELVTRPASLTDKTGRSGEVIPLVTNYFRLESTPDWRLYHYHVDFAPEVDDLKIRKALLRVHKELFRKKYLFDGMALYLPFRLEHDITELTSARNSDGAVITIKIKLVKELPSDDPICLQIYNIQLRRNFDLLDFTLMGRNFYDMHNSYSVRQHGLELWPGYITAICQHEMTQLMCVDLSFKVLRTDTVDILLRDCLRQDRINAPRRAQELLIGSIVLTRYNNRTYRIDDVDFESNSKQTFKMRNGTDISFIDYYQKQYGLQIRYPDLPLLLTLPKARERKRGQTDKLYLIPELCTMTGLTDEIRSDFNVMKDLAKYTRVGPAERVQKLQEYMRRLEGNQQIQEDLKDWNISYSRDLVEFQGRILPQEDIFQRGIKLDYKQSESDWSRDMRGKRLQEPGYIERWCVVVTQRDSARAEEFLQALYRVCPPMDMRLPRANVIRIPDDRTGTYIENIKDAIRNHRVQLVFAVLPNNRSERYNAIKKFCCIDNPVASQIILAKTLNKNVMSVATKVAIQLNCKLGGEAWAVAIPVKNIMVVGYDTYHDSAQKGRSVGGIVGSTNATLTKYYSKVTFQNIHQEVIDGLEVQFTDILKNYYNQNKCLPERIIFYRDGVGEGQLKQVQHYEIPQIKKCFEKIGPNYNPRFAFIVVTKRINTRFFSKINKTYENPIPGTVVDTEVTRRERYDFFLVSQSVRQGTVAPTNYNVIEDTTNFQPDHMQRLAYKLTHLYYNWPGTIRVPAPCQYAHKLAFLVGQSLHKPPHEQLANTLFYL